MPGSLILTGVVWLSLTGPLFAQIRTWSDRDGQTRFEAELMDFDNGDVWLRAGGHRFPIPLGQLSQADQDFVRTLWSQRRVLSKAEVEADASFLRYGPARQLATLANPSIDGSSGLASSRRQPGLFWTHNDSGHDAHLYLTDKKGRDLGFCVVDNARNFDWEDLASFSWQGKSYLLVADTGNNGLNAAVHMLLLIEEPAADPQRGVLARRAPVLETLNFSFEDDFRDCEAMAVDPADRSVLLVSKERGLGGHVYQLAWPSRIDPRKAYVARRIAALKLPPATALDVSADGRRAILGTYESAYEFRRREKETWAEAFARPPREIPMPRRAQGESICYGTDGKTLYVTSERLPTPLWEVPVAGE